MDINSKIRDLKGIGEKTEQLFTKLGVLRIKDLVNLFPRDYDIYEEPLRICDVEPGKVCTVSGVAKTVPKVSAGRTLQVTTLDIQDESGTLNVIWYRMPFLKNTIHRGQKIILRGKSIEKKGKLVLEHPEIFSPPESYDKKIHTLQPLYPLTAGLSNNAVIKAMHQALEFVDLIKDCIPQDMRLKYHLAEYNYAIREIHFPIDKESYIHARERLAFEEFLLFLLAIQRTKENSNRLNNDFCIRKKQEVDTFIKGLPYELTNAQKKVWNCIEEELTRDKSMARLVQGDVGCGKTVIALLAMMMTGMNGYQSAMMAPTEVLARQHYEGIVEMFEQYHIPLKVEILTGSMTAKEKREAYARIESGEVQIILGTHALIQDKVNYHNLALVITDEQHRFGVRQRESFSQKGKQPHILVMSATPIPRTLAIILYGDLDISVIDELPSNRIPIKNCVVDTGYREKAYAFMKKEVANGHQCYVICPMVEESDAIEAENVIEYSKMLQEKIGSEIKVAFLHGKMKQKEKDRIMQEYADNHIQILVSTTVIEVGINVPNATVMMVENAERFGLAQLHQLRGRVGRGASQSYCIFVSGTKSRDTRKRLEILNKSNDGFFIAGEDLKLRGPGDLFGIAQSGIMNFKIADVYQDAKILMQAGECAKSILREDRGLKLEKNSVLRDKLDMYLREASLETTL